MSIHKITLDIQHELEFVRPEKQLQFIQEKLSSIADENVRKAIETALHIGIEIGLQTTPMQKPIVVLLHGIRTHAVWFSTVKYILEQQGFDKVFLVKYGYFDAFRFWFPSFFRKGPINKVLGELRDIRTNNKSEDMIVVAHSFGTYIISKILKREHDIDIERLLLCGSIVDENYEWRSLSRFPSAVLNDCGSKDMWPNLAKTLSWGYGNSGVYGFNSHRIRNRFHNLGHSDFFAEEFISRFWVPFIAEGEIINSDWDRVRPSPSGLISLATMFPWKTFIVGLLSYLFLF